MLLIVFAPKCLNGYFADSVVASTLLGSLVFNW